MKLFLSADDLFLAIANFSTLKLGEERPGIEKVEVSVNPFTKDVTATVEFKKK
jgi:hypothetical protein